MQSEYICGIQHRQTDRQTDRPTDRQTHVRKTNSFPGTCFLMLTAGMVLLFRDVLVTFHLSPHLSHHINFLIFTSRRKQGTRGNTCSQLWHCVVISEQCPSGHTKKSFYPTWKTFKNIIFLLLRSKKRKSRTHVRAPFVTPWLTS